jgi:alanine dehydrogenase
VSSVVARASSRGRRTHARKHRAGKRLLAGGVAWIVAVAVLLAGVVALNVAVLQRNLHLDSANRQRAQLKADIAADQAKLASATRTGNIVKGVSGLVEADPAATTIIDLPR